MKKTVLIIITALLLFACGQGNVVEKPDNLISEEDMVNMLYDVALLQATRSIASKELDEKTDSKTYIYKKYKIDSLTFVQSHKYYASRLDQYEKMQKKVTERLTAVKSKIKPDPKEAEKPVSDNDTALFKKRRLLEESKRAKK